MTITRRQAWTCALVNQLACPGIGTIMARKWIGFVQAAVMIAGFCMAMAYGLMYLSAVYKFVLDPNANEAKWNALHPSPWLGVTGFALCGVAWFWALLSSLQILRAAGSFDDEPRSHQPL